MAAVPAGLYVHVPFCDGKCRYCAFYSTGYRPELARRWLASVQAEYRLFCRAHAVPVFNTVYIGGGTPTLLEPGILEELAGWVRSILPPGGAGEWSVEANPGSAGPDRLRVLKRAGVNRLSIGAQAFDDARLSLLGRRHAAADIGAAVAAAREAGFDNIGLDLIAGGPGCGARLWRRSLEKAAELEPSHVSVYALTVEEGTALARAVRTNRVRIAESSVVARLHEAQALLERAGYVRYEVSNYARPGRECRHHIDCWRGERYLGLGPAAASHVGMRRWTNAPDVEAYVERLEREWEPERDSETLTPAVKAAERLVFGLRLAEGVDLDAVLAEGEEPGLRARWESALAALVEKGLVARAGSRWALTSEGMDFADAVAVELL
jgi:oxygen-independent coproporphyrinogen-3 oxidase